MPYCSFPWKIKREKPHQVTLLSPALRWFTHVCTFADTSSYKSIFYLSTHVSIHSTSVHAHNECTLDLHTGITKSRAHSGLQNTITYSRAYSHTQIHMHRSFAFPSACVGVDVLKHQMLRCYDSSLWILQPLLCSWLLHYGICLISLAGVICCTRGGVKKCSSLLLIICYDSCDV